MVFDSDIAVVLIGRNEGDRLKRCLQSVTGSAAVVVYVDSGSTDGSVAAASKAGATVVALDLSRPFTAARARNAGFEKALAMAPDLKFIQFVDGDCEVEKGWIAAASSFLAENPAVAAVFGRRREHHADQTIYNRLCDIEWNVKAGPVKSCGGDVMIRSEALRQVGGYRVDMIAGEEPELCVRLRRLGWHIHCIDRPMTIHDAAMSRFGQWWRRAMRSGHAYAEGASLHGAGPEYHSVRECFRALFWGGALPLAILASSFIFTPWLGGFLALAYAAQIVRLYLRNRRKTNFAWSLAIFTIAGNFPETCGIVKYHLDRMRGTGGALIEYKS